MKPGRELPGVGVGAVVFSHQAKGRSLLMIQRGKTHGEGLWSVPGGWVEMWEDPLDAAVREVREETGIVVRADRAGSWASCHHLRDSDPVHAVTLWVFCLYLRGDPTVTEPDKVPVVEWVPYAEVAQRPLWEPFERFWGTG